jgi:hypothetical protein
MLIKLRQVVVFIIFLCISFLWSDSAQATQTHGEPEGLYSHLIAHAIFFLAMVYLAYRLICSRDFKRSGWRSIFISAILFALWNLDTFYIHVYQEILNPNLFAGELFGLSRTFHLHSLPDLFFYVGRLDHLLSLPALLFLLLGIRALLKHQEKRAWT